MKPGYAEVIAYYLRDDVAGFFWRLSQTRQLKFFHHCATDPRGPLRARPQAVAVHCPRSVDELRDTVRRAAEPPPEYSYDFFPFWGMQTCQVNAPGDPDRPLGWDLRLELDFDLRNSFDALLPVAATLDAFGVPCQIKYSGHRSLHFVLPAEAMPADLRRNPDRAEWFGIFERFGRLFCRLSPWVLPTHVDLAKEMALTAPYSLHRFHGLLSLPLTVDQALDFDEAQACLDSVAGVSWPFPEADADAEATAVFLDRLDAWEKQPGLLYDALGEVFAGDHWHRLARRTAPADVQDDGCQQILMAGAAAAGHAPRLAQMEPATGGRLQRALAAIDDPAVKTIKFGRLVTPMPIKPPFELIVSQRRPRAEVLETWVNGGLEAAVERIARVAGDESEYAEPVLLAVRLCSFLPEDAETIAAALDACRGRRTEPSREVELFLCLAAAERVAGSPSARRLLVQIAHRPPPAAMMGLLQAAPDWRAEARPELTLAALTVLSGQAEVSSWIADPVPSSGRVVVDAVFGGNSGKLRHGAQTLARLLAEAETES